MKANSLFHRSVLRWTFRCATALTFASTLVAADAPESSAPAQLTADLAADGSRLRIEAHGLPPTAPLFFSATAQHVFRFGTEAVNGQVHVHLHVLQGRPEVLSLALSGDGDVIDVTGAGLRDWSVRQDAGDAAAKRFLDLRPVLTAKGSDPRDFDVVVRTRLLTPDIPGKAALLLINPGEAVSFSSAISLQPDAAVDLRVTSAVGVTAIGEVAASKAPLQFTSSAASAIGVAIVRRGAAQAPAELLNAQLAGRVDESLHSVAFTLRGQLRADKTGARLRVLSGLAALDQATAAEGWHVELIPVADGFAYDLVADRPGMLPVELGFAAVIEDGDEWQKLAFKMPAGAVVPLRLEGFSAGVEFDAAGAVVPNAVPEGWRGFLPASGIAELAWKHARKSAEGALFFTSLEQAEVRVGAGLLRQESQVAFRILQGKLSVIPFRLEGPGEILGVAGTNVVSWNVRPTPAGRTLEVRLSRPFEAEGTLTIRSQATLEGFPVRAQPLRLTPEGAVRHSGFVRIANNGAARLEVADVTGMMQLAPAQFPGPAIESGARQVFVYRFPSADYDYRVVASQIQSEVAVSQVVTYELTETDRVINAELELDVREAALRDWSLRVPEDYAVVAVSGNDVVDHVIESEAANGSRALKILFGRAIEGRQLLKLRLEKNQPAAAGEWRLPALIFPGAKSVRGHIGAVSAPGYRIVPGSNDHLVEVPLSFFPRQTAGLQQAWRLRDAGWAATVRLEALGQSVQADLFHLYSIKEGVVYGSVLLNYFVVGAPATEWRIEVPESVGNIDVVGQNVRRDWRREGNQLVVTLHQPVLGAATLLVTFEQPMSARGGSIRPGEIKAVGVQGERGYVQVVSPLQVKHSIVHADGGLLKLEPRELPAEFRLLNSAPSLAVYQYTARPFTLEMGIEWYAQAESVDQVIDFAKFSSQVSRDGQVVTEARFFVKTRGRQALRMTLAKDTKLWEARVDREIVTARADGAQTLVPLPARTNPNEPVEVALRIGQNAPAAGSLVQLVSPKMMVPVVIDEWIVRGDSGRVLVPRSANAELVTAALTETGFEWIDLHKRAGVACLAALVVLAALLLRGDSRLRKSSGVAVALLALAFSTLLGLGALFGGRANAREITYAATVKPTGEPILIQVTNSSGGAAALISWTGVGAALVGLALVIVAGKRNSRVLVALGALLLSGGVLVQHGGAVPFFLGVAALLLLCVVIPAGAAVFTRQPKRHPSAPATGAATAASLLAILVYASLTLLPSPTARAEEKRPLATAYPAGTASAQSLLQKWSIREQRLFAEMEFTVRGASGSSLRLLAAPAVLTDFQADGMRAIKAEHDGQAEYQVVLERDGTFTARAKYEMPLPETGEEIRLPTPPAALQRLTVDFDQPGWEFISAAAVRVEAVKNAPENHSGATLTLTPTPETAIELRPVQRNVASEVTQFFSEISNLYVPGPGVVNGYARILVRPAQGRVSELELDVPNGFTVGEVSGGPIGAWRFDPEKRRLHVSVQPAQTSAFKFNLEMQRSAGALPVELALEPLRMIGAADEIGMIALGFGGDAQPENIRAGTLSPVNVEDFDGAVVPRDQEGQPLAVLQRVWRHGREGGRVELKVAPVAAEIRVASRELLTLDDDRLVAALDFDVAITRVGIFKLSFVLPAGLEVEALSGPALNHWTETTENAQRVITLHLNGRTIGDQHFTASLAGAAPRAQGAWAVPRFHVREATRQTGELLLVPGKGIRLHAVDRQNATQLDPRSVGGLQPGTLAFRLLQQDWALKLGIETLDAWVTAQALAETTVREGQTLTRLAVRYRIENAALKHVRMRLPGLSDDEIRTVRGTGSAVSDFVKVAGETDVWECRFQRGIAGETDVVVEFQNTRPASSTPLSANTPVFVDARQTTLFAALRSGGRVELEANTTPRGWQRVDWSSVPANLQSPSDRSVPVLCFRVAEPEGPLVVAVRRHDAADALRLRVTTGDFTTLFSPEGASLTAVDLKVDVIEKSTLRIKLPDGARLFSTLVNSESVTVVREGEACLFNVTPNSETEHSATVRLVYAAPAAKSGGIHLTGPSLNIPLEGVSWHVVLPTGYELKDYTGSLQLREDRAAGSFSVEQYKALVSSASSDEARKAAAMFEEATALVRRGDQQRAGEALSRAAKNNALDQASNEDARVQLRELKTQQAILGLNTRRQRLYLDNRGESARNEQLEQAVTINPFMQGKTNFNPQQVDQLLMGNTVEENTALRGIATRIVEQQLTADPAPGAINVTLPERGRVVTFTRSLQVDGSASLSLTLELQRLNQISYGFMTVLLSGIALLVAFALSKRSV